MKYQLITIEKSISREVKPEVIESDTTEEMQETGVFVELKNDTTVLISLDFIKHYAELYSDSE